MASKIKLIASDMDGTLLDENGQVPPETFDLILALRERGVRFVASSGRRYDRLCDFFSPVKDRMDFVASNGAQVFADGVQIDREVYSHLAIRRLAKTVAMFPNMHLALFDRTKSYLLDDEDKFVREVDKDLPNVERIYELPSPQVSIIKASIFCDDGNVMDNAYVLAFSRSPPRVVPTLTPCSQAYRRHRASPRSWSITASMHPRSWRSATR